MTATPILGFNRYDLLKLIALVAMTLDHVGFYYFPDTDGLRILGRVAAPLFLFLVGYNQSYRFRWELLAAAVVSSLGDGLLTGMWWPQSILWTILLGRMVLQRLETHPVAPGMLIVSCALLFVPLLPVLDTSAVGLLWMLFGRATARAPRGYEAALYGGAALVGGGMFTVAFFDWNPAQLTALGLLYILAALALWHFRPSPMRELRPARFWSRHALSYYVLHKLVLQGARLV